MVEDHAAMGALLSIEVNDEEAAQRRFNYAFATLQALHLRLQKLVTPLAGAAYPFEHARGAVSLEQFLTADMPPYENDLSAFQRTGHVLASIYWFHARALGHIATLAEDVEKAAAPTAANPNAGS